MRRSDKTHVFKGQIKGPTRVRVGRGFRGGFRALQACREEGSRALSGLVMLLVLPCLPGFSYTASVRGLLLSAFARVLLPGHYWLVLAGGFGLTQAGLVLVICGVFLVPF